MTTLSNRVISVFDKKTSMRLAKSEWNILDNICLKEHIKRRQLLELIETHKDPKLGLTPSVRLFSLLYLNAIAFKSAAPLSNTENETASLQNQNNNILDTLKEMCL